MKKVLAVLAVGALLVAGPVSANSLQISFTGLNLMYDGTTGVISDGGGANSTRPGDTSLADALTTMDFFDMPSGNHLGGFYNNIYADIYIPGVFNIPAAGGFGLKSVGPFPSFGFDLFIGSTILALNFDTPLEYAWSPNQLAVKGSARTELIQGQALPFGITIGAPVDFGFDILVTDYGTFQPPNLAGVDGDGEYLSRFTGFGTGDVKAPISGVPEPATLLLLGFGLLSGGAMSAKRRRK